MLRTCAAKLVEHKMADFYKMHFVTSLFCNCTSVKLNTDLYCIFLLSTCVMTTGFVLYAVLGFVVLLCDVIGALVQERFRHTHELKL